KIIRKFVIVTLTAIGIAISVTIVITSIQAVKIAEIVIGISIILTSSNLTVTRIRLTRSALTTITTGTIKVTMFLIKQNGTDIKSFHFEVLVLALFLVDVEFGQASDQ